MGNSTGSERTARTRRAQLLVKGTGGGFRLATSWHPSGKYLAYQEPGVEAGYDVFLVPVEGDVATGGLKAGEPTAFLNSSFNEWQAAFSPDGQWLAYSSNETGRDEVYVRPVPGPGGTWQVSTEGGSWPTWSRKSSEIFYEALDGRLMVASYEARGDAFNAARPRLWSDTPVLDVRGFRTFDLHPDGQRVAVLQPAAGEPKRNHVVLFLNFFDELRRLAPTR
jgi:serine/threonine-protein kinase